MVCASKTNPSSNYNAPEGDPSGWAAGQSVAAAAGSRLARCHLAPSVLGGSGATDNLSTCWRTVNVTTPSMRTLETRAQKAVTAGLIVQYMAIPIYDGPTGTIPVRFDLSYIAWTKSGALVYGDSGPVSNDGNGRLPNLGN